jgi:protein-arginine kinase activator protein McsA
MPKVQCPACSHEFTPDASRKRFCDSECYRAYLRRNAANSFVDRFWAKSQ